MHVIFVTGIVFVGLVITALLFLCWVMVVIVRGVTRLILGPGLKPPVLRGQQTTFSRKCVRDACQAANLPEARFCRRCGQQLQHARRISYRSAAVL